MGRHRRGAEGAAHAQVRMTCHTRCSATCATLRVSGTCNPWRAGAVSHRLPRPDATDTLGPRATTCSDRSGAGRKPRRHALRIRLRQARARPLGTHHRQHRLGVLRPMLTPQRRTPHRPRVHDPAGRQGVRSPVRWRDVPPDRLPAHVCPDCYRELPVDRMPHRAYGCEGFSPAPQQRGASSAPSRARRPTR